MSSLSKFLLVALTALGGVAANAHTGAEHSGFQARSVIASHEAAPALSAVVYRHHHHHRRHHARPVHHVR